MTISQWPTKERPREKLLHFGAAALSDAELLAIFIRTGTVGATAIDIAHHLLHRFGGINAMMAASQRDFCAVQGLGLAKYVQLQAVLELSRRQLFEQVCEKPVLNSPEQLQQYLRLQLGGLGYEVFAAIYLDNQHHVLAYEELSRGTIDAAAVYPREVVKQALANSAAAMIFAHNHPSGVAEPSRADEAITRRLIDALALVDIRVLDHMVVAGSECVSFAERGLI